MAARKQISLKMKFDIIKNVNTGMKQISKKYGLSQSTIATVLKNRKEIEQAFNSNDFDPRRKRIKTIMKKLMLLT